MNPFGLVYMFTPTVMIYFGLPPLIAPVFTRWLLSLLLFPTLVPKGQQRHDNQKSIYRSHSLCRAGEGIRYSDVVGLPLEHKAICRTPQAHGPHVQCLWS